MNIGYFLTSEEWGPRDLVELAVKPEQSGFNGLWIAGLNEHILVG
jgi:hypothetical protein